MLPYRYINHDELAALVHAGATAGPEAAKKYVVVDVRDEDYEGGNIPGAIRAPSDARTDASIKALVEQLKDVPRVVFHCSLSQVRGPKTARIYAEALADYKRAQFATSSDSPAAMSSSSSADVLPNPYPQEPKEGEQQVLVLRDGFKNWQGLYRNDPILVENWDARAWQEYTPFGPSGRGW
ncbi:hypothetical protein JCM8547_005182 [Rhodosporidiobolus lusitaniae]